jgi:hypothetical protein
MEKSVSQRKAYKYLDSFRSGSTRDGDKDHSGCPSNSRNSTNVDQAGALIQESRKINFSVTVDLQIMMKLKNQWTSHNQKRLFLYGIKKLIE